MTEEEKINRLLNSIAKSSVGIIADEVKEIIIKQEKEIEELKERNENLNWYFENQKDNFVHKDKIREKIKELKKMKFTKEDIFFIMRDYAVLILIELLEE